MRLLLSLMMLLGLTLTLQNCKPEKDECHDPANPECENYDPCYGQKAVKAEIELSQRYSPFGSGPITKLYSEMDSVFPTGQIRFHCPLDGAKYTWTLGAETITAQTFERNFFNAPFGEYTVKLTVEKKPNKNCFPNDDSVDTYIQKFKIVPPCSLAIMGVFIGKWDNLPHNDSGLVSIRSFTTMGWEDSCNRGSTIFRFTNLQGIQDTLGAGGNIYFSNSEIIQDRTSPLSLSNGRFKINLNDNSVQMTYTVDGIAYVFKGRRISD